MIYFNIFWKEVIVSGCGAPFTVHNRSDLNQNKTVPRLFLQSYGGHYYYYFNTMGYVSQSASNNNNHNGAAICYFITSTANFRLHFTNAIPSHSLPSASCWSGSIARRLNRKTMQFKIASNTKTQKPRRTRLIAVWCARILCWISGSRELVTHETPNNSANAFHFDRCASRTRGKHRTLISTASSQRYIFS